jgi:hypothetical protein
MTFYKIREQAPPDSLGGRATLLLLSRVLVDSFREIKSKSIMKRIFAIGIFCLFLILASSARAQTQASGEPALPYIPSLDVSAMDKSIDPCVDFTVTLVEAGKRRIPFPPIRLRGAFTPRGVGG